MNYSFFHPKRAGTCRGDNDVLYKKLEHGIISKIVVDKWIDRHHTPKKVEAFNVIYGGGGLIKFSI